MNTAPTVCRALGQELSSVRSHFTCHHSPRGRSCPHLKEKQTATGKVTRLAQVAVRVTGRPKLSSSPHGPGRNERIASAWAPTLGRSSQATHVGRTDLSP